MSRSKLYTCLALVAALFTTTACAEDEFARDPGYMPRSLDGTEIDGAFHYDREGNFEFDEDAQRAFDYFLTAEGEIPSYELQAWVEQVIAAEVSPKQRGKVIQAWHDYVSYRAEAAAALDAEGGQANAAADPAELAAGLLASLDAKFAGTPFAEAERAEIERAFALRAIYDQHDDDRLSRDLALAALDADNIARFETSRAGQFLAAREAVEAAREAGASATELHALRAELYDGQDAADRLAALDQRRAQWDARVAAHEQVRAELSASWIGSPEGLEVALDELDEEAFKPIELRRLRAQRGLR